MLDEEMVDYLFYCMIDSKYFCFLIEMLLYVFLLYNYVDYIYFDVIISICCVDNGK